MGFDGLVRNAVALANSITGSLQVDVVHRRWISADGAGKPTYAANVTRQALVERKQRVLRTSDGQEVLSTAYLAFLSPLAAYTPTVAGRQDPIDGRDRFTLPDGTTGPIVKQDGGLFDPATGRTYLYQVWLGE